MRPRTSHLLRRATNHVRNGLLLLPVLLGAAARAEPLPSLDAAVARARKYAPMVIDADGQVAVARAALAGARVLPLGNPQIEVTAGQQRTAQLELDAKLYLPVEIAGQRGARIAEADRLVDFRALASAESRARLTGEVTAAWGMAMVSAARVLETRLAADEAQREVDWVAARQSMGAATVAERSFAEAEIARWFQLAAQAQVALGQAQTRLAQLVALPEVELPAPGNAQAPPLRFVSEQALLAHVNETAPLLRSLGAEANFWRASAERYQRERLAPVSLVLGGGRGDLGEPRVGGGLAWALPAFRRNQGEIGRALAEAGRAESLLAATRDALGTRVRGDWRVLVAAREALTSLESTGLGASERLVEAATAAWRAGKSELVQVIIARRDLASARLRRLDLVETIWRMHGDLAALTGELP